LQQNNSISSLVSEINHDSSEESTYCPSPCTSDTESSIDDTLNFTSLKSRQVAISNQFKSIEVMPLDTSLFNDLDEGVERHVIYISRLDTNDSNKFLLSTPARASLAFHCYWEGCPTSERIK